MEINIKYKTILLEALEDKLYQLSLRLNQLKGESLTVERKRLTRAQREIEELQHIISIYDE